MDEVRNTLKTTGTHLFLLSTCLIFNFFQLALYSFTIGPYCLWVSRFLYGRMNSLCTYISLRINSNLFSTFTFASLETWGTKAGPMSLYTVLWDLSKLSSYTEVSIIVWKSAESHTLRTSSFSDNWESRRCLASITLASSTRTVISLEQWPYKSKARTIFDFLEWDGRRLELSLQSCDLRVRHGLCDRFGEYQ